MKVIDANFSLAHIFSPFNSNKSIKNVCQFSEFLLTRLFILRFIQILKKELIIHLIQLIQILSISKI